MTGRTAVSMALSIAADWVRVTPRVIRTPAQAAACRKNRAQLSAANFPSQSSAPSAPSPQANTGDETVAMKQPAQQQAESSVSSLWGAPSSPEKNTVRP
ncbi:MAG: hypothetical protein AAF577_17505 [Pseudomonadota bacterium]